MAASTTTLRYPSYMNNDLMLGCAGTLDEIGMSCQGDQINAFFAAGC